MQKSIGEMADYIQFFIGILICVGYVFAGVQTLRRRKHAMAPEFFGERRWRGVLTGLGFMFISFGVLGILGAVLSVTLGLD